MEIKVLGSLVVRHREGSLTPTAAKPRTVLAMLAMHANDVVPVKALVDELWGDAAPRSARTTVQTYVVQLRKLTAVALGNPPDVATRSAKQILATVPGGYLLSSPNDQVDVRRFEQQASAGHREREHGDFEEASKRFADALSSWRGPALADVQTGPHLSVETTRLEEARLNALYCRIEADLRLGRHHELLSELAALVARHRTHEGLCAHLMLALYRSGRRCEALDIYHRLYSSLTAELGLEPTPALRRLQRSMLVPDRGSAELTESWHAATSLGHRTMRTGTTARDVTGHPRRISAELASMPWDVHTSATGGRSPVATCMNSEPT